MLKETEDHEVRGHWMVIRQKDMPQGAKRILSIWWFNLNHFPNWRLKQARLCAHGVGFQLLENLCFRGQLDYLEFSLEN